MAQPHRPPHRHRQDPEKVVQLRIEKGLYQKDLAARVGITPAQMCRIETGKSGTSVETLHKIAKALGVKVTALMPHADLAEAART